MKKFYTLIIAIISTSLSFSQTVSPFYKDTLSINQVSAMILNNSDYAWDLSNSQYLVPKNNNSSSLFAASMWVGGYYNGALRVAAMTYRQNGSDFWPGPLDTTNTMADTAFSSPLRKLWKIKRFDVANFIYNWNMGNVQSGTFIPNSAILNWPAHGTGNYAHNMAPFVDVNSNGIYDPINDGDYPLMRGDEMIWWVFNDNKGSHGETGGYPLGIEVHASAYAFVCPTISDSDKVLNYTTFYHYDIFNRTTDKYDSSIIGLWIDTDLGNYQDDYIGCDVMNNYGFVYNGDSYDEDQGGHTGYHTNLPAFSCNVLNGPVADLNDMIDNNNNGYIDEPNEVCLMNRFTYYTNTGNVQTGNPNNTGGGIQHFNFLNSKWRNGTPMTYGGNGTLSTNPVTKYVFPGMSDPYGIALGGSISNPVTPPINNWTQYTAGILKGDMRFLIGMGPFTMMPLSKYEVDYALVFSQDSSNCYGAADTCVLARAKQDNIRVKNWFAIDSFPSCLSLVGVGIKENAFSQTELKIYPNPANNYLFIEFKEAQQKTTIEIYDMLGKIVKAGVFTDTQKYISIPVEDLSKGIYTIKIKTGYNLIVRKFVKE